MILAGWNDADDHERHRTQTYFALILALLGTIVFVFAATDLFLFYVAFEVMLIPVYFLIGMFGRGQRTYAAVKFLLYSLFGGLLLLAALIGLYVVSVRELGKGTFDWNALAGMPIDPDTQKLLFVGFFFAFAVKAPMVPVHTWLPDAAASGTAGHLTLLVGVLDKVGDVRDAAALPTALPGRLGVGRSLHRHDGGDQHHLRRAGGHRTDRHEPADRLHVGVALRFHHPRDLRLHGDRRIRLDRSTWWLTACRRPRSSWWPAT